MYIELQNKHILCTKKGTRRHDALPFFAVCSTRGYELKPQKKALELQPAKESAVHTCSLSSVTVW